MVVTKETIINDVLEFDANAAKVFHMNGMFCTGCPHARSESIADACAVHGTDADKLIAEINAFLASEK